MAIFFCCALMLAGAAPANGPATAPATSLSWLSSLDRGYKDAARQQRPMLVIFGAEWCAPCRALEQETQRSIVREKLAGWTLVHIDVDKQDPGSPAYVGAIPALRLFASDGKPLAAREGYLSGEELIQWLADHAPKITPADPDLTGADAPDAAAVGRLVARLIGADAGAQEAAAARLAPWPRQAAKAVAEAFASGNLRARLATLDLLQEWKAPIIGIDAWQPETIDAARLQELAKWARRVKDPATRASGADASELETAPEEIAALLRADDPADAAVISARLARLGNALLPSVTERLKSAATDRDRERLAALRYRLVATEKLALSWPGGIERLAAADAQTRHAAAEQLAQRATAADGPLLLELFSDPDPLVREISLRSLQNVGGAEGTAALVKLLHDPVANVRAAVLKQLAEEPRADIADAVVAYIAGEKDPDLTVHAIRVLRAARGPHAVNCLIGLLEHPSWQVRAEAIDSLANISLSRQSPGFSQDEVLAAVLKRLDDPDGFVAGRALAAVKPLGSEASLGIMNEAVKKHPELAMEVIKLLASEGSDDPAKRAALKSYCASPSASVRAAAIGALAGVSPGFCEVEIQAALKDTDAAVRAAGGNALFQILQSEMPGSRQYQRQVYVNGQMLNPSADPGAWLTRFQNGEGRAAWYEACVAALETMLKSNDQPQRMAAAFPLAALGHEAIALPQVLREAQADPDWRVRACQLLPWLPWEKRLAWFNTLAAMQKSDELTGALAENMARIPDSRAGDIVWALLGGRDSDASIGAVYNALYALDNPNQNGVPSVSDDPATAPKLQRLLERIKTGNDSQRVVALALLTQFAATEAANQSKKLYEAANTAASLRADAFQVMLHSLPAADAQRAAVETMKANAAPELRMISLRFLALGGEAVSQLHESIYLSYTNYFPASGQPIVIAPPEGISVEMLTPLAQGDNLEQAAYGGYLLCLLKKPEGLAPLLAYWNQQKRDRWNSANQLVYQAIATLDDDAQTPILEQIYKIFGKDGYRLGRFYWTIRTMHGPNILKLRKTIRDEMGMLKLQ